MNTAEQNTKQFKEENDLLKQFMDLLNQQNIDNIVVSDISKVKCLQMVGRARRSGSDDRKTLYIKRFNKDYVRNRIHDFEKQKEAYHEFELAYRGSDNLLKELKQTHHFEDDHKRALTVPEQELFLNFLASERTKYHHTGIPYLRL